MESIGKTWLGIGRLDARRISANDCDSWAALGCDDYQLELFGLNCPPPGLDIEREAQPDKVRVHWSTAYPGWQLQSVSNLSIAPPPFQSMPIPPVMAGGRYNVTNDSSGTHQFYRLFNP